MNTSRTATIEFLDANGNVLCTKTVGVNCLYPKQGGRSETKEHPFQLQIMPNPTSGNTTIRYTLAAEDIMKVEIYTSLGNLVAVPEKGMNKAGEHILNYSTDELPPGVYYIRLTVGGQTTSLPLVLSKQ